MENTKKLGFIMSDSVVLRSEEEITKLRGRRSLDDCGDLRAEWESVTAQLRPLLAHF